MNWTYSAEIGGYIIEDLPLNCDGDGANGQSSDPCYVPEGSGLPHLDNLANAGHPGNWWGLACRPNGIPFLQGPTDPAPMAYISTTAYQCPDTEINDPMRYLDAASVPFIVVPASFVRGVPGIVKGCACEVEYKGKIVPAMVGDVGPQFGEFSLFLCKQFDPNATCHGTSISSGVTVRVWPGKAFPGYVLQKS